MQQYFVNEKLNINQKIILNKDVLYHTKKVLRKEDGYIFRMADSDGDIYLVRLDGDNGIVIENTNENNELDVEITVLMSLIKSDKWDLTIQKLTELGVKRIVPLVTNRCVVKASDSKKLDRFKKIMTEASEQSHRNFIPEICEYTTLKNIDKYKSENNYVAYEKQDDDDLLDCVNKSITIVIGPEGGFEPSEIELLKSKGFKSISLGKRILRAETAAIFATSLIVGKNL